MTAHFAVLSFGGIMGLGDKRFAYPLRIFQVAPDGEHLVLNVPKEALKAAPGFERGTRPDWNDAKYRAEVDRCFGDTVQVEPRPNMMLRPAHGLPVTLRTAPTFAEERWPDFNNLATRNQLDRELAGLEPRRTGELQAESR